MLYKENIIAVFQPPPTWANPILVNEETKESTFNPVWLKWFVDLVGIINTSGGGGGAVTHNSTTGLQGGQANQYYHFTATEYTGTGTGAFVRAVSPSLTTPALGTPSALVGTNITGTAAGLTAGAVAVGGVTGLGAGVATWLATPSSANLASAVTGETGSGALVFGTAPAISTPVLTGALNPPTATGTAQTSTALYGNTGAPNNADGSDGDFYFRSNGTAGGNTVIYHKEAGAWVALVTT